jgi:hypothetical protein
MMKVVGLFDEPLFDGVTGVLLVIVPALHYE